MLILTRRIGETLICDDNGKLTEVTVLGVKGNQVRLGVQAPRHVGVDREEIYQRKQAQKKAPDTMTDRRKHLTAI
ncbi:carbon storage regulator CsrA [Spongiibacter taiwanensis]|uniref:carbon storage regulator CsrA n=1 Tax=Spongiibacter taiwanensis TaxID=1748242 RepID=UPI0020359860|nr:carbon storage regulator CsrA [Spongiibacter taiwanensis]USA43358.1 carbon storage regulator CsrA [Spongiibacter taiwanensis]